MCVNDFLPNKAVSFRETSAWKPGGSYPGGARIPTWNGGGRTAFYSFASVAYLPMAALTLGWLAKRCHAE
jgi:hypothetical protein